MREGEVHAAVAIEIERDGARGARRRFAHPRSGGLKWSFERIHENLWRFFPSGDDQIDRAVIIQIAFKSGDRCGAASERRLLRVIAESAATEIAPKDISGRRGTIGKGERLRRMIEREIVEARDVDVEVAIVIVVDEGDAEREADGAHAGRVGDIFEGAVAFIVEERDAVARADDEIGMAVVVVIADGAAGAFAVDLQLRGFRDVDEFAVADIVEKRGISFAVGIDEENVGLAIAIVIEDAGAAAEEACEIFRGAACGAASDFVLPLRRAASARVRTGTARGRPRSLETSTKCTGIPGGAGPGDGPGISPASEYLPWPP